jgi:hypothetical protein
MRAHLSCRPLVASVLALGLIVGGIAYASIRWDPDGSSTFFLITDEHSTPVSLLSLSVSDGAEDSNGDQAMCWSDTDTAGPPRINLQCNRVPRDGATLTFMLVNP